MADVNLALDLVSNVQEKRTHRVRKFSFGDGYEQISADGVNTRMSEYDITTRPLTSTDALVLRNALDDVAVGDYFLMTLTPFSPRRSLQNCASNSANSFGFLAAVVICLLVWT